MIHIRLGRFSWACALGLGVAWIGGCADSTDLGPDAAAPSFGVLTTGVVQHEDFKICKDYVGQTGPAVTFDVQIDQGDDGSVESTFTETLNDGECKTIYTHGGSRFDRVTVTEQVPVPATGSYAPSYVMTTLNFAVQDDPNRTTTVTGPFSGNSASAAFRGFTGTVGVLVEFTNTYVPPPDPGCTYTQGYWKTHSILGPAGPADDTWDLVGGPSTAFFLSGQTWYQVFWTSPSGNAYYNLAHQYMAAKLNVLSGADPTAAASAIASAEALFGTYTPAQIGALKGSNSLRQQFVSLAGTLDYYNMGLIGPGHCDDEVLD